MKKDDFFRSNDYLEIIPFRGRKTSIKINRVDYLFSYTKNEDFYSKDFTFFLPVIDEKKENEIFFKEIKEGKFKGYFYLESIGDPFKVNGSLVYKKILKKGDVLKVEHNIVRFKEQKSTFGNEPEFSPRFEKIFSTPLSVFLQGETGVGKTRLARKIHESSTVIGRFVHLNLSAFSQNLLESELFGHKKGAFTGAIKDYSGAIFEAREGTLFLDEIDSMNLDMQKKLLLFLDDKAYRVVGGGEKKANVRLIFSSGQDLKKLVRKKLFRKDLYYRIISNFQIRLSPIREDRKKIKRYIKKFELQHGVYFSIKLKERMMTYDWPGNYRELKGHVEKKYYLRESERLDIDWVDDSITSTKVKDELNQSISFGKTLEDIKAEIIKSRVNFLDGDLRSAGKSLGISEATVKKNINK